MASQQPDNTAARTALWRALHLELDSAPAILEDRIGYELLQPDDGWRNRPDMDADFTKRVRVSIVTRARFIEDELKRLHTHGINQYVLLGAGLDTFGLRNTEILKEIHVFEIDRPATLAWKQERISDMGYPTNDHLHYVPVDFEQTSDWLFELKHEGFDMTQPAFVACTGVSLYLTHEAILDMLKQFKRFAKGSVMALSFLLPIEAIEEIDKPLMEISMQGAARSGNPFRSMFTHQQILDLVAEVGFADAYVVAKAQMMQMYFAQRSDGLEPASGEDFVIIHCA